MEAARLTAGAVKEIAELPNGPGTTKPVLQVVDVRSVSAKGTTSSSAAERYRMLLSDGVHSVQSMLATALNHLVRDGSLCAGSIVHLQEIMCNTIQGRRIIIVVELDVLQSQCDMIGKPKIYEMKNLPDGQAPNLQPSAAQINNGTYAGAPGMLGSSVAPRVAHVTNNISYGGSYNSIQGTGGISTDRTVEPGPYNVLSGESSGTMSAQSTTNANMVHPKPQQSYNAVQGTSGISTDRTVEPGSYNVLLGGSSATMSAQSTMNANIVHQKPQQPLLNSHQNQRFAVPATAGGYGPPGNTYGRPVQPLYQQPPSAYVNRGPVCKNEAAPRVVPISSLNPYQGRWTIKARVTAKGDIRLYSNSRGAGKVFSFDLLDADGGEIRATCFNEVLDRFFNQIEVEKVYLISRGSLKPANKTYNPLNSDYEITLDTTSTVQICSGDDTDIPRQQFNFRQITEIESIDANATVDLLGIVTSISPSVTIMTKNGREVEKRTLQLRDMSGCSVEVTLWGNFCNGEGQELQSLCDSGLDPILALKSGRVSDYNGRSVGTTSSSLLKINPDFPDAERLKQWYNAEGKMAACTSLSREMSSMSRPDARKTIARIKEENLGLSDKGDWITIKGTISHVPADNFCYPACTLTIKDQQGKDQKCNKKVTNNGDGTWRCDRCDNSSETVEYRYLLNVQIQDHTGVTYAIAFNEIGEQIFGKTAQELFSIRNDYQDDAQFSDIIQGACWHLYMLKLKIKEEKFNDEARVKCSIVKAEKMVDLAKENHLVLGVIDSLLQDDLGSTSGVGQSVVTSNNAYGMNMGGTNQFGQQASISGGVPTRPLATQYAQICSLCGLSGHSPHNCPSAMDMQQPPAGGGFTASAYGSSAGNSGPGLCYKCNKPGHFSRDCPELQVSSYGSSGGGNASSGLCYKCNKSGHFSRDCPEQQVSSYGSSGGGNASSGLCYKCNQPGHFARDCPAQSAATAPQRQTYGNGAASGGYNRQSYVGGF